MSFIFYVLDSYCEKLSPPENGAIICEPWMARLMCTVHCNEGYDMAFRTRPWYYCESDGNWRRGNKKWSKKPTVPECSGTKIAQVLASSLTTSSNRSLSVPGPTLPFLLIFFDALGGGRLFRNLERS